MSHLQIEKYSDREYQLLSTVTVITSKYIIRVSPGFIFDGASVPKIFWGVVGSPFTGKYTTAALVHDALYASELLKREDADDVFLELMEQSGVNYFKRYAMYWAVRLGGGSVWEEHTECDVKEARMYIDVKVIPN